MTEIRSTKPLIYLCQYCVPVIIFINFLIQGSWIPVRHSRGGRNPDALKLDSRLRESDNGFVTYLRDSALTNVGIFAINQAK